VLNLEQTVLEKLRSLPPEKRQIVLDFVDFLAHQRLPEPSDSDLYGLWSDLDISISEDDIKDARREMWSSLTKVDF
jgi:hypothetical protein